jgi:uncharacterized protein
VRSGWVWAYLTRRDHSLEALRFGRWRLGWAVLAFFLSVIAMLAGGILLLFAIGKYAELAGDPERADVVSATGTGIIVGNPYSLFSFVLVGIMFLLATVVAARVQGKTLSDFCQPIGAFRWGSFAKAIGAFALAAALTTLPFVNYGAEDFTFRTGLFRDPVFLAAGIAVIALQTLGEEAFFRGYLLHSWGAILPIRLAVVVIVAAIFTAAHTGNADLVSDPVASLLAFFVYDLFYFWLVRRTGAIDAVWGWHFANNLFGFMILNTLPGYATDASLMQYTDPVLASGGSYIASPWFYASIVLDLAVAVLLVSHRRSPFYIEPRT